MSSRAFQKEMMNLFLRGRLGLLPENFLQLVLAITLEIFFNFRCNLLLVLKTEAFIDRYRACK